MNGVPKADAKLDASAETIDRESSIRESVWRDAEKILDALESKPDGYNTTTWKLAHDVLDSAGTDTGYLFELHFTLCNLADTHGLILDSTHHAGMDIGLPFNIDYFVRHKE